MSAVPNYFDANGRPFLYEVRKSALSNRFSQVEKRSTFEKFTSVILEALESKNYPDDILDVAEATLLFAPDSDSLMASLANFATVLNTVRHYNDIYKYADAPGFLNYELAVLDTDIDHLRNVLKNAEGLPPEKFISDSACTPLGIKKRMEEIITHCNEIQDYLKSHTKDGVNCEVLLFYHNSVLRVHHLAASFLETCSGCPDVPVEMIPDNIKENLPHFDKLTPPEMYQFVQDAPLNEIKKFKITGLYKLNHQKMKDPAIADTFEKLTTLGLEDSGSMEQFMLYSPLSFYQHLLQTGAIEKKDGKYHFVHPAGSYWPKQLEALRKISDSITLTEKSLKKAWNTPSVQEAFLLASRLSIYLRDLLYDLDVELSVKYDRKNSPLEAIHSYFNGLLITVAKYTSHLNLAYTSSLSLDTLLGEEDEQTYMCNLLLSLGLSIPDCWQLVISDVDPITYHLACASAYLMGQPDSSEAFFSIQPENRFDMLEKAILLCHEKKSIFDILASLEDVLKATGAVYREDNYIRGVIHAPGSCDQLMKQALDCTKDFWDSKKSAQEFERSAQVNLSDIFNTLQIYTPIYQGISQLIRDLLKDTEEIPYPYAKSYFLNLCYFGMASSSFLHSKGVILPEGKLLSTKQIEDINLDYYKKTGMPSGVSKPTSSPKPATTASTTSSVETPSAGSTEKRIDTPKKKSKKWLIPVLLILLIIAGWKFIPTIMENRLKVPKDTADYHFLMELQDAILEREELTDNPDTTHEALLAAEQQLFALHDTTEFKTEEIEAITEQYLQGLRLQEASLSETYVKAQLQWQEGVVTRIRALAELKKEFGFGGELKKNGYDIKEALEQEEFRLKALQEIEAAIRNRIKNLTYSVNGNKITASIANDTGYEFNLHLCFKFFDNNDTVFKESHTEFHVPGRSYPGFEIDCPDSWGRCRIYWEIDLLSKP